MEEIPDYNTGSDMTGFDRTEPVQTGPWISVAAAAEVFAAGKIPRNKRSIRRYCERGELECRKTENENHQPFYLIAKDSIFRYIAQQRDLQQSDPDTIGPDRTEPDGAGPSRIDSEPDIESIITGHDRTEPELSDNEEPTDETEIIDFLKEQIRKKDEHIDALLERDRETNHLIQGLQNLVLQLQPSAYVERKEGEKLTDSVSNPRRQERSGGVEYN